MACNPLFYARDQMLQVQTNLIGSLSILLNEIKSYRAAVFSYKLTNLNSVMAMVNKLIPMALLPRTVLEEILKAVVIRQTEANERISLAIPTNQLLTYYEKGATALNLYRAIPVLMHNERTDGYSSQYAIECDFIAIAESTQNCSSVAR